MMKWEGCEIHKEFQFKNIQERDYLGDLGMREDASAGHFVAARTTVCNVFIKLIKHAVYVKECLCIISAYLSECIAVFERVVS